jgi:hypothetical protein
LPVDGENQLSRLNNNFNEYSENTIRRWHAKERNCNVWRHPQIDGEFFCSRHSPAKKKTPTNWNVTLLLKRILQELSTATDEFNSHLHISLESSHQSKHFLIFFGFFLKKIIYAFKTFAVFFLNRQFRWLNPLRLNRKSKKSVLGGP